MSGPTRTLSGRLALLLCVAVLLAAGLFAVAFHYALHDAAVTQALRQQRQRQDTVAAGLVRVFSDLEARAGALAWQLAQGTVDAVQLDMQLRSQVLHDPDVTAMAVFLEADNPVTPGERIAVSVAYDGAGISARDFLATGYDFAGRDWYLRTMASESGYWSDIFFNDAAGGMDTVNYDLPLVNAKGRRIGMLGVSVSLDRIAEVVRELGLANEHRYLLTDGAGRLLVAWEPTLERAYTLNEALQRAPQRLRWMVGGRLGGIARDERYEDERERGWRSYTPLRPPGWHLIAAVPDRLAWAEQRDIATRASVQGGLLALLVAGLGWVALRSRLRPLRQLLESTDHLATGAEDRAWSQTYQDRELHQAAERLRVGGDAVRHAREALQAEQNLAAHLHEQNTLFGRMHRMQQPDDRTFFGSRFECAWQARLHAGDPIEAVFHGFLATRADSCHFFLGVPLDGDVPPLLSMGQLCGSLPRLLRAHPQPDEALVELSSWIALERPQGMAFRLVLGRIDLASGATDYVCAGAQGPIVLRAHGAIEWPDSRSDDEPLRRDQLSARPRQHLQLGPGDRLLLSAGLVETSPAGLDHLRLALESTTQSSDAGLLDALLDTGPLATDSNHDRCVVMARLRHRD